MKLYIQENQGAASIINQLTKVDSNEIKLIFPNETDFFNNSDNLELLMNQARLLRKNISIITENPDHLLLIQKFGIKAIILILIRVKIIMSKILNKTMKVLILTR